MEFRIGGHASVEFRVGGHAGWLWPPIVVDKSVNVWLQSRSLPARGRVGLGVHRCLCIIDAGIVFISTDLCAVCGPTALNSRWPTDFA